MGCGTNKTVDWSTGIDVRPVTDIKADISLLPMIETGSADAVISRHSFEHVLDLVQTMHEWIRILKPGGKLVMVLPEFGYLNTMAPVLSNNEHMHAFNAVSFISFVTLFPEVVLKTVETVVPKWSFGVVLRKVG